jgi:tryptophan-rich sensory protein
MPSLRAAILKNLAFALLVVGIENMLIFSGIGFSSSGTGGGHHIGPIPGWIIGVVWTGLFAGLGVVRGVMEADGSRAARRAGRAVLTLLAACAAYPFYTLGLNNDSIGLLGNVVTICLSVWVTIRVGAVRPVGVIAPLAVAGWVLFATVALIDQDDRGRSQPGKLGASVISQASLTSPPPA